MKKDDKISLSITIILLAFIGLVFMATDYGQEFFDGRAVEYVHVEVLQNGKILSQHNIELENGAGESKDIGLGLMQVRVKKIN